MTTFIQIGATVLSLVISPCLIFIVVRVIRRKQNKQEKRSLATHKNLTQQNVEESISGSQDAEKKSRTGEHSFEVGTYELAGITYLEEERQHTGGEESHYDHLRDTVPIKPMEEDIYNHLQTESESNYSTFTGHVEHHGTVDDTYSHVDFS
ncbi:uncharacterized protein LOC134263486 [Saccostrea cucullata]|uniref:uncharacterized protein LOC134263486 n=1 Tax=Saccostrea cuccullata TaxID=36930 RepID=UPI002ED2DA71